MVNNIWKNSGNIFSYRQRNILSAALVLMILILVSSLLGLVRNRMLAGVFFSGQERLLDVYFAAFRLPDMIYQLLMLGGMSAAFIPIFSDYLRKEEGRAFQIASSAINLGFLIFLGMAVIVYIWAEPFSRLIAPGFNWPELKLMVSLTRLLLIAQGFFMLSGFMTGILQSFERFLLPALAAVFYNLGIISGIIFLTGRYSIYGVVYGVIIGALIHFLVQLPLVIKLGFNYRLVFLIRDPGVKKIFKLMLPRMLSLVTTQINLSVSIFIATTLSAGALSLFSFAQNIINLPVSLFGLTIGQASLPALSREASYNQSKFQKLFTQSVAQVLYLSLPASIVLIVLRIPVVRLVLGAKNFPWEATILTGKIVAIFSLSVGIQSLTQLLIRYFYAVQDTKTPFIVNAVTVIINIGLAFLIALKLKFGVLGLAIAGTVAAFGQGLILFFIIMIRTKKWFSSSYIAYLLKIVVINVILAGSLWLLMRALDTFLDTTKTVNLVILTGITLAVSLLLYIYLSWRFKIREIFSLYQVFRRFGRWRQVISQSNEMLEAPSAYD